MTLICLYAGQQICSDTIILEGEAEVNESLLTGESDPINKVPGDQVLSGSFVISGKCYAKVEHVGNDNYATHIAHEAKNETSTFRIGYFYEKSNPFYSDF